MKLRTIGLLVAVPLLGLGCEETPEAPPATDEALAPAEGGAEAGAADAAAKEPVPEAPGPAAVCAEVLAAASAKNVEELVGDSLEGAAELITADTIEHVAATLAEGACGEATVDGEKATVPVKVGEETRELGFAKAGDAWKFDAAAFLAANPAADSKGKKKGKNGDKKGKKKAAKKKGKK